MLTHELNNFTMSEAVKFYPQLKAAFKNLVPMGVAINQSHPYVETNYSLPNFEQCPLPLCWRATMSLIRLSHSDIAGTTTIQPAGASATSGSGQAGSSHKGSSGAGHAYGALGGLAVSAAFVGTLLRLLM